MASHGRAAQAHCRGLENGRVPAPELFGSRSRKADLADLATSAPLCQESCDCCPPVLHRWLLQSHSVHDLSCHPSKLRLLIKTNLLSCPSSLYVFAEFLSTGADVDRIICQSLLESGEDGTEPLCCQTGARDQQPGVVCQLQTGCCLKQI